MPLLSEMDYYALKFHATFCYTLELYLLQRHFALSVQYTQQKTCNVKIHSIM